MALLFAQALFFSRPRPRATLLSLPADPRFPGSRPGRIASPLQNVHAYANAPTRPLAVENPRRAIALPSPGRLDWLD